MDDERARRDIQTSGCRFHKKTGHVRRLEQDPRYKQSSRRPVYYGSIQPLGLHSKKEPFAQSDSGRAQDSGHICQPEEVRSMALSIKDLKWRIYNVFPAGELA